MKEELKELIIAIIIFILLIPVLLKDAKQTERDIKYCMDQGYSKHYCSDLKR